MSIVTFKDGSAEYAIESSGSACLADGAESFSLRLEDLEFLFTFKTSPHIDGQSVEEITRTEKALSIALINFNNPIGTMWSSLVGTFRDRELYVSLSVNTSGHEPPMRTVTFSLYTKEKIK